MRVVIPKPAKAAHPWALGFSVLGLRVGLEDVKSILQVYTAVVSRSVLQRFYIVFPHGFHKGHTGAGFKGLFLRV